MKKVTNFLPLLLILSIFITTACSDNLSTASTEDTVSIKDLESNIYQKSKTGIDNKLTIKEINTIDGSSISIMKDGEYIYFGNNENLKIVKDNIKAGVMMDTQGPFTTEASKTVIATNQVDFFSDIPGWAAQNFITDHWGYIGTASIPQNTVGVALEPSPTGWTNLADRISGITFSQSPSGGSIALTISTFTIWVKSTILGHPVGIERPTALTDGFEYTYYYIEF